MSERALQRCLKEKYGIEERLMAEGMFVQLVSRSQDAACLVRVGLGERCLVLASVCLAGNELDYDLMNVTPYPLLNIVYNDQGHKLRVSSRFKAPLVFQLCSSKKHSKVWGEFTTAIDKLTGARGEDTWCNASFTSTVISAASSVEFERHPLSTDNWLTDNTIPCKFGNGRAKTSHATDNHFKTVSLPSLSVTPNAAAEILWRSHVSKSHSVDCLDPAGIQFESFVGQVDEQKPEVRLPMRGDGMSEPLKKSRGFFARLRESMCCRKNRWRFKYSLSTFVIWLFNLIIKK